MNGDHTSERQTERTMGSIDDTRFIGEAWAHATSLSADGELQQAIMAFLRLRCGEIHQGGGRQTVGERVYIWPLSVERLL